MDDLAVPPFQEPFFLQIGKAAWRAPVSSVAAQKRSSPFFEGFFLIVSAKSSMGLLKMGECMGMPLFL